MVEIDSNRSESLETSLKGGGSIAGFVPTIVKVAPRRKANKPKKIKKRKGARR